MLLVYYYHLAIFYKTFIYKQLLNLYDDYNISLLISILAIRCIAKNLNMCISILYINIKIIRQVLVLYLLFCL